MNMSRVWIWALSAVVVLGGAASAIMLVRRAGAAKDESLFQEQMRRARAEGMPTTAAEYAATIPPAKPEDNAAPLYRKLRQTIRPLSKQSPAVPKADLELTFHPSPEAKKAALALLSSYKAALDLADQAAKKPRCWFDRDWSQGYAVLFPEYADIKALARAVLLRGSLAAAEGRSADALADTRKTVQIAKHAREEPHLISHLVGEAIYQIAMRDLVCWAFTHRDVPVYREELSRLIDDFPRPDLKAEHSGDLYSILAFVDQSLTPEGRKMIGLKEEDIPSGVNVVAMIAPPHAKARIVEAEREIWGALSASPSEMAGLIDKADRDLNMALLAYPIAAKVFQALDGGSDELIPKRKARTDAVRREYVAVVRAISGSETPKKIDTSDLLSPFDGKPLKYSFDGHQIVIEVSGSELDSDSKAMSLKIPPDSVFKGS